MTQNVAQENVELKFAKIKKIEFIGIEPVYNMEVEKHHNFSINGGLIVHNSIDSIRYGLQDEMDNKRKGMRGKAFGG